MKGSERFDSTSWKFTATGCGIILLAQAAAVGLVLAADAGGQQRLAAVGLAAAITGAGGIAGWLVARVSRRWGPPMAAAGGLAATALRLLPPLITLAWITAARPQVAEDGLGGLLVGFYLSMLVVAIFLHILEARGERSLGSCEETI
jgi:hypothetical protein